MDKFLVVIQARLDSKRFPNKVLKEIAGLPSLVFQVERIKRAKFVDKIIVAIPKTNNNDALAKVLSDYNITYFRGSDSNVLKRFTDCAKQNSSFNHIVRITGDCPLSDPNLIDEVIAKFKAEKCDYITTGHKFPDGVDVEIIQKKLLIKSLKIAKSDFELEHVTPAAKKIARKSIVLNPKEDFSDIRLTIDEVEDYQLLLALQHNFKKLLDEDWLRISKVIKETKSLHKINSHIKRNEGAVINTGQKYWKRAKKVIPLGNHLLSKNPEYILPEIWPSYFSKARGVHVWDLDNNKYLDMSLMGVGTNSLGYGNNFVDAAVKQAITKGNMSTLNCVEEILLAERLISLHKNFTKVRFARSGGEANSIAVRIARAATGKDEIAICGYHGWHDWYLSANLEKEQNLSKLLMPGLAPIGVPKVLQNTAKVFHYGNQVEFDNSLTENTAAVIMEFARSKVPDLEFLEYVRRKTKDLGIVLIFDECSTGFRETFGGMHLKYNILPDMVMYGKTLGNGYAITAVLGIEDVMTATNRTFVSSTFWTERIGYTAGLATLKEMEKIKSWELITSIGLKMQNLWQKTATEFGIDIKVLGYPAISSFVFNSENSLLLKTYFTQEMLKHKILGTTIFYSSTEHKKIHLDKYAEVLSGIFKRIAESKFDANNQEVALDGPVSKTGFGRLN
jgi:glutamate-1-semialdehyde 2,1-aminomutase